MLLQTLIKRSKYEINSWDSLMNSNIINENKINNWIVTAKNSKNATIKFEYFMNQLKEFVFKNKNVALLETILNSYCKNSYDDTISSKINEFEELNAICDNVLNKCDKSALAKLTECINDMVLNKLAVNDTLMLLSLKYNKDKFTNSLITTLKDCLETDSTKKNAKYQEWFRKFVLNSNILSYQLKENGDSMVKADEKTEEKTGKDGKDDKDDTDSNSQSLLFDKINLDLISKKLIMQKEFIKNNIIKMEKEFSESWNELINFSSYNLDSDNDIRQYKCHKKWWPLRDIMKIKGTQVDYNNNNLINDYTSGFNGSEEYSKHGYLTKLLINCIKVDPIFQSDCKNIFTNESIIGVPCKFMSGAVKKKARCIVKSSIDYHDNVWPNTGYILDINRNSVIFNDPNDMINGIQNFIKIIGTMGNNNDGNTNLKGCMFTICRIKNMFNDIIKWRQNNDNLNDYNYCDLKMNVIIEYDNIRVIGEIQFILDFFEKAKKMGHIFYSFQRNYHLYHKLNNIVQLNKNSNEKEKLNKLHNIISRKDSKSLINWVLFGKINNLFLNYEKKDKDTVMNQLYQLCIGNDWQKGLKLLKNAL